MDKEENNKWWEREDSSKIAPFSLRKEDIRPTTANAIVIRNKKRIKFKKKYPSVKKKRIKRMEKL